MEAHSDGAAFDELRAAEPSPARVDAIRNRIAGELRPVRPLPSNRALASALTAAFICLGVACAIPIRLKGYYAMTKAQMLADCAAILLCAFVLAFRLAQEIVPGAPPKRVSAASLVAAGFAVMAATTALLFPDYSTAQFVQKGLRCLTIGTLCAIPAAGLLWRVMRLGMLTDRASGLVTAAALAGMVGVFTLALHCPILTAAHILAWHLTVPALALASVVLFIRRPRIPTA